MQALIVNLALLVPFLDQQTFAVAHVDVTQMDLRAIHRGVGKNELLEQMDSALVKWKESFAKAGGKDVFLVFSLADQLGTGFLVIPCPDEAHAAAIGQVLKSPEGTEVGKYLGALQLLQADPVQEPVTRIGNAYVVGPKAVLERLRKNKSTARPEFAKAFEAAGNGAAQFVLAISSDQRRVIEEMVPTLPADIGGASTRVLTRGLIWSAIGIEVSPKLGFRWHIQSQDEASAQALQDWLEHFFHVVQSNKAVQRYLPQYEQVFPLIRLKASGTQLTLVLKEGEQAVSSLFQTLRLALDIAAGRSRSANNLKQVGLALHSYHDRHGLFPTVANFDKEGKPLLSWRVHLLPWLDQEELYKKFHLEEPWDSDHNKALLPLIPEVYRSPSLADKPGYTPVLGPVGKSMFFTGAQKGITFRDITDGTSNTIMVVEVDRDHAVPWTKPEDLKIDKENPASGLADHAPGGYLIEFCDGSAHFLQNKIDKQTLYFLFTRDGGEVVDQSKF